MSRSKRRGDNTAPALFPFLAVLLCTIGALVLILVLTVANSHASAKREAEDAMVEVKDTADLMQVVSDELEAQREGLKAKVERRRRDLADIEDHIARLSKTLDRLVEKIDRIQSQAAHTEKESSDKLIAVQDLKKEIDQKKKELIDEIERQKKRKPAFAVIPYAGSNGTSRRPVYLECTKNGVLIQPEGLLISLNDLKPPLGPGNPLDAALRVLRLTYQQKDTTFGITQPPYPLLIVRPDGIQTYALAREAMSGWDDQFGYELVDNEMELTFPPSPAGLKDQLATTVELAKRRQQALIAAMPRRVVPGDQDDNWDSIDASSSSGQTHGDNSLSAGGNSPWNGSGQSGTSQQREWQLIQGMASSQVSNAIQRNGGQGSELSGNAQVPSNAFQATNSNKIGMGGRDLSGQFIASDASQLQSGLQQGGAGEANRNGVSIGQSASEFAQGESEQNSDTRSAQSVEEGAGHGLGGNGTANQTSGSANSMSGSVGSSVAPPGANAFSNGTASGGGASSLSAVGTSAQSPTDPSAAPNLAISMNPKQDASKAKHVRPEGDLKPISVSAGHGWAASRAEGKATPVSRSIVMIALKDRWLLRSDEDPNKFELNVTMEGGPQRAGNELATAMRKRVDSWGLSVPGGYWSPTLTIESANDAQQSVARLQRLLEGSGVEIKVVPLTIPNRR